MIISDKLLGELIGLEKDIRSITEKNSISNIQMESFLRNLEKRRYNILNQIKVYNETVEFKSDKIKTISNGYKSEVENNILKIYIPEPMPSYKNKNLKTHAFKNILLNLIEVTKPFSNLFNEQVFVYIKIFDKIQGWDVDNKFIKPIPDALIANNVIKDDNIAEMFYCVKGEVSENPHTEVYITKAIDINKFLEKQCS